MKPIKLFVNLSGSTQKPEYIYRIIEHLVQGRRRIEIFGEDHNLQPGWLTIGNGLSSSNFNKEVNIG
jgi:N6-adenosine-specific RNA methylase IME4